MSVSLLVRLAEFRTVRKRRHDLPTLRGLVSPDAGTSLLDLGGGAGSATIRFAVGFRRVVVLEPDRGKVHHGRRRRPGLAFVLGRAEGLPFRDASFGRVVGVVSFHHVDNPAKVAREARRVLSPGSRFVLLELHPDAHMGRVPRIFGTGRDRPTFYEPAVLRHLLESHGFRDVAAHDGVRGYFVVAET